MNDMKKEEFKEEMKKLAAIRNYKNLVKKQRRIKNNIF